MKKKFLTNLALLMFLNLIVKTFWVFGIDRKVQNIVGSEEYGIYFSLLSLSILLNILLDVGITNFNNRAIARNHNQLTENISLILPLKLALSVIYGIIVLGVGIILDYSSRQFSILGVLILNQFLLSLILYLRSNLSGLHLFRTDALVSVADRLVVIIICSFLIWGNLTESHFQVEWLVYSQTVAYFLSALIILGIVLSKTHNLKLQFGFKNGLNILRKSYPFAILILLMSFFNRFDSVFLERFLPDGKIQAGIYAQSFRILDAVNMFAVLIAGMLLPIFSRMIKQNEALGEMVKLSFSLVFVPAITLAALSTFFNHEIISLLYTENISISANVYQILIWGFVFISINYVFGTLLTANHSLKELNTLAAITVIINLSLNILLIPRYQARGAAIASVCSQAFYAIAQTITAKHKLNLKIHSGYTARLTIYIVSLFLLTWVCSAYIEPWGLAFLIICSGSLVLAALCKILTPGGILRILKDEE